MRRRLFTLAAAVSLLLCLATAALWVRSYWRGYGLQHADPITARPYIMIQWIGVNSGRLIYYSGTSQGAVPPKQGWSFDSIPASPKQPSTIVYVRLPIVVFCVLFAIIPVF